MGIMDGAYGGAAGLGAALVGIGQQNQRAWQEQDLVKMRAEMEEQKAMRLMEEQENIRQRGKKADFDQDVANAPTKNQLEVDRLKTVAEAQSAIDTRKKKADLDFETENIGQISGNARKKALAAHIVDPSYTAMTTDDGSVVMVNTKNPKQTIKLTGDDGKPLVIKNTEELRAISTALNAAKEKLRTEEAAYKAEIANAFEPEVKAAAERRWKEAQAEYQQVSKPAMERLFGKGKMEPVEPEPGIDADPMFKPGNKKGG